MFYFSNKNNTFAESIIRMEENISLSFLKEFSKYPMIKNSISERIKILLTSHSTRIEGSTLTFAESTELIQKGNTPGGKHISFSLQTIDHYNALNFVLEEADNKTPISKEFIQKIASMVMKQTGEVFTNINGKVDASKGEFRKTGVWAGTTSFMNYQKIIPALDELCTELNQIINQQKDEISRLKLSFYAHYKLVNIHPFLDGNGRTSRLLMNYIQRWYDLPLSVVFAEDKAQYYEALNSIKNTESFEQYYEFMFSQYQKFLETEIQKQKENQQELNPKIQTKF